MDIFGGVALLLGLGSVFFFFSEKYARVVNSVIYGMKYYPDIVRDYFRNHCEDPYIKHQVIQFVIFLSSIWRSLII